MPADHPALDQDWIREVPECVTYYPTAQQFKDPIAYIQSIQGEASKQGICKVVPPCSPSTPAGILLGKRSNFSFKVRSQVRAVKTTQMSPL